MFRTTEPLGQGQITLFMSGPVAVLSCYARAQLSGRGGGTLCDLRLALWIDSCPPERYAQVLTVGPENLSIFGLRRRPGRGSCKAGWRWEPNSGDAGDSVSAVSYFPRCFLFPLYASHEDAQPSVLDIHFLLRAGWQLPWCRFRLLPSGLLRGPGVSLSFPLAGALVSCSNTRSHQEALLTVRGGWVTVCRLGVHRRWVSAQFLCL